MDPRISQDLESRLVEKFYAKVRQNLKNLELAQSSSSMDDDTEDRPLLIKTKPQKLDLRDDISTDKFYGKIDKKDIDKLLKVYENQQKIAECQDRPVKERTVTGESFDRHLFSKIGFHNQASTDYLLEDLAINDTNRWTFLGGGITNYDLYVGEDLHALDILYNKLEIRLYIEKAWDYLDRREPLVAIQFLNTAKELDPNDGDVLGCQARVHEIRKEFKEALSLYSRAWSSNPRDKSKIQNYYSDCLYNEGYRLYHGHQHERALQMFEKSIEINPGHNGSKLHRTLCQDKIRQRNCFPSSMQLAYRK